MIVLYRGARGRGKTLSMCKDAFTFYKNGYRILSNIKLKFGEYISQEEVLKLNKGSELYNCVLVLDELQLFFDSRNFAKKENKDFSNFIQQIRKRNIIILGTTQYIGCLELRFRQHIDCLVYPTYDKVSKVCCVKYFDITILEDYGFKEVSSSTIFFYAPDVFPLYDTYEMLK
jgi:hypothetical protein